MMQQEQTRSVIMCTVPLFKNSDSFGDLSRQQNTLWSEHRFALEAQRFPLHAGPLQGTRALCASHQLSVVQKSSRCNARVPQIATIAQIRENR